MMSVREVVLDTETTGLSHINGDKIIEIGCVEIVDKVVTGANFHTYLNTDKRISATAFNIHGISNEFLKEKPLFKDIVGDLIAFIGNSKLIIHNAKFDIGFINNELTTTRYAKIADNQVIDTLPLARKLYPGQSVSLDSLCKRFAVNLQKRNKHGALIDSELLALVYIEMTGAKQVQMMFQEKSGQKYMAQKSHKVIDRQFKLSKVEKEQHAKVVSRLNNSTW